MNIWGDNSHHNLVTMESEEFTLVRSVFQLTSLHPIMMRCKLVPGKWGRIQFSNQRHWLAVYCSVSRGCLSLEISIHQESKLTANTMKLDTSYWFSQYQSLSLTEEGRLSFQKQLEVNLKWFLWFSTMKYHGNLYKPMVQVQGGSCSAQSDSPKLRLLLLP